MEDRFQRQMNYLRISVTDRCNLRCQYCMPVSGIELKNHRDILRNEEILKVAKVCAEAGVEKIRITGGEPLVRKGLVSLIAEMKKIEGIQEIAMTTNGLLLESYLDELIEAGLSRVNISLDSLKPEVYRQLTRGGDVNQVLRAIEACKEKRFFPIKLNVVVIGGVNDEEVADFIALAETGLEVRFIELMPIGEAAMWSREKYVNLKSVLSKRNDLIESQNQMPNSPAKYYDKIGSTGRIGIISPISDHFCSSCNRIRLTSDGMLRTCLHSNQEVDLKPFLKDEDALGEAICVGIVNKPEHHHLNDQGAELSMRNMNAIGG